MFHSLPSTALLIQRIPLVVWGRRHASINFQKSKATNTVLRMIEKLFRFVFSKVWVQSFHSLRRDATQGNKSNHILLFNPFLSSPISASGKRNRLLWKINLAPLFYVGTFTWDLQVNHTRAIRYLLKCTCLHYCCRMVKLYKLAYLRVEIYKQHPWVIVMNMLIMNNE